MIKRKILPVFLFALVMGGAIGLSSTASNSSSISQAESLIFDLSFQLPFQSVYVITLVAVIICLAVAVISRPEVLKARNIIRG